MSQARSRPASPHPVLKVATLLLLPALLGLPAIAAFKKITLEKLIEGADEVLMVEVIERDQVMGWMEGAGVPLPFQRLRCRVLQTLKGTETDRGEITLHIPGGALPGDGHFTLSTAPAVEELMDGPTVVFVNRASRYAPAGGYGVNAGDHGVYPVRERNGVLRVEPKNGSPIARPMAYDVFQSEVRRIATREAQVPPGEGGDR